MSEIIVTNKNFSDEVLRCDRPILVDFRAEWCGPCRMMATVVDDIAEEYSGRIKVGIVNIDEETALAERFSVSSIPALILFDGGKPTKAAVGYMDRTDLKNWLGDAGCTVR